MSVSIAAVIARASSVSDRVWSRGFAVAIAGYDVPAPVLSIAELEGHPGWSVAFYTPGLRGPDASYRSFEHAMELFGDDLPPALAIRECAEGNDPVYAILWSEDDALDDAWRFDGEGFLRRFVRDGDDGLEAGEERPDAMEIEELEGDDDGGERTGTGFLAAELRDPRGRAGIRAALAASSYRADPTVRVALVEPTAAAIARETSALNRALRRDDGRGAFELPSAPPLHRAFTKIYDFRDPSDAADLYREVAIGAVRGTLHFLREPDLRDGRPFVIAELRPSALGGGGSVARLALAGDGDELVLVRDGSRREAGPRFGELIRYLALGYTSRSAFEEDEIAALMLRAELRVTTG